MDRYMDTLQSAYENMLDFLPLLAIALLIFFAGFWVIRLLKRYIKRKIMERSDELLTAEFAADLVGLFGFLLLIIFCLGVMGFSSLMSKLLAGAGLTAFIVGFAMKDIGENFLSGIVLVFNRPFRTNDIIEQDGFIGRVLSVSLRETVIKSLDGKDVFIPNADILKKPLQNYTIDDLIRTSFRLWIFNDNNIPEVIEFIRLEVSKSLHIQKKTPPRVLVENFQNGMVQIRVNYWYSLKGTRMINDDLQSKIMMDVFEALKAKGVRIPNHVEITRSISPGDL